MPVLELKRTHFYFIEENLGVLPDYFPANTYKNLKINKDNKNVIKITYNTEKTRYNPKTGNSEYYDEIEELEIQKI